tara:strand:+ start:31 stop:627 length:597 start_codon:yes stop_codon:yes gene_type:complete
VIEFNNLSNQPPYLIFKERYEKSLKAGQKNIEAICISSYSKKLKEVNARFVNLKFIIDEEFIFFSNYESVKSQDFLDHNQITGLFYWHRTNTQIRIKANIKRTTRDFNKRYFAKRDKYKNALAISSSQSKKIKSYEEVKNNYMKSLGSEDLNVCPENWGGFAFIPYYFEFWRGHESRLNKREVYEIKNGEWINYFLQP